MAVRARAAGEMPVLIALRFEEEAEATAEQVFSGLAARVAKRHPDPAAWPVLPPTRVPTAPAEVARAAAETVHLVSPAQLGAVAS